MKVLRSILLKNAKYVICDKDHIIEDGAIAIEDDRIVDVGKTEDIEREHPSEVIIDATEKAIIPGLINTHTHLGGSFLRGLADGLPLAEWFQKVILPSRKYVTSKTAYIFTMLGCIESIKSGITCINNNDHFSDSVCQAIKESGIRGIYVPYIQEGVPEPDSPNPDKHIKNNEKTFIKWNGAENDRIRVWFGAHSTLKCSPDFYLEIHDLAEKYGVGIHTHLASSMGEIETVKKKYGKRPIELLHDIGVLGPNFTGAHCIWPSDKEIKILKRTDTKIAHDPHSNMKLAVGYCRIPEMLAEGISVGLGTDGIAGDCQDLFQVMRITSLIHKFERLDASVLSARTVFDMATMGGAKVTFWEKQIGSLERGKKADLVLIDLRKPYLIPLLKENIISRLVHASSRSDVDTVIIDGRIVMENREVKTIDERERFEEAQRQAEEIAGEISG